MKIKDLVDGGIYLCNYKDGKRYLEWCKGIEMFNLYSDYSVPLKEIDEVIKLSGFSHRVKYIPKDNLVIDVVYVCKARNFTTGTWNGKTFSYVRTKFGEEFIDEEDHWDDGPPHGTVKPITPL